ncbi:MAG TPA: hypothetical protein DCY18_08155 [Thauera sp.]|nr:hypothetical protein [Thauera sp.]
MPLIQPLSERRCISCDRWHGRRRPGDAPDTVEVASPTVRGVCIEGPWHRSLRGVRSACGQWLRWRELPAPVETPSSDS